MTKTKKQMKSQGVYMNNKGWECPKCSKCYAPHVDECKNCNNSAYIPQDPFTPAEPSPWTVPDPVVPWKWEYTPQCNCHLKNGTTGIWCPVHDVITITSNSTNWGGQTSIHWPFEEDESDEECGEDECEGCIERCKCYNNE